MRTVHIEKFHYKGDLAEVETDVEFILSDSDFEKYKAGAKIEDLDSRISAEWIETLERRSAAEYFRLNYRKAFEGKYHPSAWEIRAIVGMFGISRTQAADILGVDKGSISNHMSGKRTMERSTAFLLLERLGLELARPGAIKAIVDGKNPEPAHSEQVEKMIDEIRYRVKVA